MNGRIQLLSLIAVGQMLVIGILWFGQGSLNTESGPWIELDQSQLTRLEISDGNNSAVVVRGEAGWTLEGLPADEVKVSDTLDKLIKIEAPWPVGTSSDALERFEVSEETYQKRVQAFSGEQVVLDLLLGTSPGYQRVHARKAGASEVFSVALSNYELPASIDGWLDKALLSSQDIPADIRLNRKDGETTRLNQSEEGWLVNGEAADQESANTYANRFTSLRVLGLHRVDTTLELQGTVEVGNPVFMTLEILRETDEGDYVVRDKRFNRSFRLATYTAEQLLMIDLSLQATDEPQGGDVGEAGSIDPTIGG
jgi:hypothetical protein